MASTPIPGIGAKPVTTAGVLAIAALATSLAFSAAYIVDCRRSGGKFDACWSEGRKIAGLNPEGGLAASAIGLGAWALGFNTYNPRLRKQEDERSGT